MIGASNRKIPYGSSVPITLHILSRALYYIEGVLCIDVGSWKKSIGFYRFIKPFLLHFRAKQFGRLVFDSPVGKLQPEKV